MTEYYNSETVNSRHLVAFSKPTNENKYYYVFEIQQWIKCTPLDNLPYGLCFYKLENRPETELLVTSRDSYRLSDHIPEHTDHEKMLKEKQWRDSIVGKGQEFDFLTSGGTWKKGVVNWTKRDIIPGVIQIGPRSSIGAIPVNISSSDGSGVDGYYYKESSRLGQSSAHTPFITQEQLDIIIKKVQD